MIQISFWGDCKIDDLDRVKLYPCVQKILRSCEFNVINFEAPVTTDTKKFPKSGPCISQNLKTPSWLNNIGFNVVSIANNHMMDYGGEGLRKTIASFRDSTIVGGGSWEEAYKVTIVEKEGIKVGFLALTHLEFGVLNDVYDRKNSIGTAWICHPKISLIITRAKNELDYLFVLPHAGIENIDLPLPEWRDIYKSFVDYGADGVIATHPHSPQGWEFHNNKPIFYSLGNFCFQSNKNQLNHPYWNDGLVVVLKISGHTTLKPEVYNVCYQNNVIKLRADSRIKSHTNKINSYLKNESKYMSTINEICMHLLPMYMNYYSSGGLHYLEKINFNTIKKMIEIIAGRFKNKPENIINNIRCESHRWAIIRALKIQNDVM